MEKRINLFEKCMYLVLCVCVCLSACFSVCVRACVCGYELKFRSDNWSTVSLYYYSIIRGENILTADETGDARK